MTPQPDQDPFLQNHRKQMFWQILFPIVTFSLLMIILGILPILAERIQNRLWADVSIIWIIFPLLFFLLLTLILLIGLIYLLSLITGKTPGAFQSVLGFFLKAEMYSKQGTDFVKRPFLLGRQIKTKIRKFLHWN